MNQEITNSVTMETTTVRQFRALGQPSGAVASWYPMIGCHDDYGSRKDTAQCSQGDLDNHLPLMPRNAVVRAKPYLIRNCNANPSTLSRSARQSAKLLPPEAGAAVHRQRHPGDEVGLVGGEEQRRVGHVPGGAHLAPQRHASIARGDHVQRFDSARVCSQPTYGVRKLARLL